MAFYAGFFDQAPGIYCSLDLRAPRRHHEGHRRGFHVRQDVPRRLCVPARTRLDIRYGRDRCRCRLPDTRRILPAQASRTLCLRGGVARFHLDLHAGQCSGGVPSIVGRHSSKSLLDVNKGDTSDRDIPSNLRWLLVRSCVYAGVMISVSAGALPPSFSRDLQALHADEACLFRALQCPTARSSR